MKVEEINYTINGQKLKLFYNTTSIKVKGSDSSKSLVKKIGRKPFHQ